MQYNLAGKTFGQLTAIRATDQRSNGSIVWECICSCDTTKSCFILSRLLVAGKTTSCGCYRRAIRRKGRTPLEAATRYYYSAYIRGANTRGYEFDLTLDQFIQLIKQPCYYCGAQTNIVKVYVRGKTANFRANGVDRSNNTLGYTLENSVSCCTNCNRAKLSMSAQQYIDLCKQVAKVHS
jgi:hypothetical protein